jgi:hypothetical protein
MSLGRAPRHEDLYRSTRELCESRLPARSIFRLLSSRGRELFEDEALADLFTERGRHCIGRSSRPDARWLLLRVMSTTSSRVMTCIRYVAASSAHASSNRSLWVHPRTVRMACPPSSPQRIPLHLSRWATSVSHAASTTPLPGWVTGETIAVSGGFN